jgi:hypothetical protein
MLFDGHRPKTGQILVLELDSWLPFARFLFILKERWTVRVGMVTSPILTEVHPACAPYPSWDRNSEHRPEMIVSDFGFLMPLRSRLARPSRDHVRSHDAATPCRASCPARKPSRTSRKVAHSGSFGALFPASVHGCTRGLETEISSVLGSESAIVPASEPAVRCGQGWIGHQSTKDVLRRAQFPSGFFSLFHHAPFRWLPLAAEGGYRRTSRQTNHL